ncbi:glycosyltransferase family 4 protein [Klebsiella michiganensis]|uniref:glycosyltransferase family 4 protein n=1 Tax=Klebsiella michiganensis TaxID=1134687 RepID=UPI0013D7EFD4|nr:glycosyltransferase family 1 protein [Klebsiella michiganensis]MCW9616112.1 glycosyltransferase family 1 protein [Klebsiella michiganensis]MDU2361557.1 glycosyltransferase family 1 protein [Klebsiella michiganensis]MDU2412663.1 glycosyltransferase family 1 protein [Klebsiella michiganensis]HDX8752198.1 glycosyltransferase family 4 protein [Klebsiella michiganensis]
MILNLTRIGKAGTGMWEFSKKFALILSEREQLDAIICSHSNAHFFEKYGVDVITTPDIVANTSKISKLRPVYWLFYSFYLAARIKIKYSNKLIISTTHHALPFIKKQVITIHDIRPRKYPDSILQLINFKYLIPRKAKKIQHILTVSNTVKRQLVSVFGLAEKKISVVYNAVSDDFNTVQDITLKRKVVKDVLMVGASWPHKNAHEFIENYFKFDKNLKLTIVSGMTLYRSELEKMVEELNITDRVKFLSNLTDLELKEIYEQSDVLVYPSKDEGFGIPPIEAMAHGLPVIVSDIPVFREILSSSALYASPESYDSWKEAFSILNSSRDNYINQGYVTSQKYNLNLMADMINDFLSIVQSADASNHSMRKK